MLDSETKKKIDDLRDILAGKTPGPESQVEQITTALIYKFMHDMDEESVEMDGKRSFFVGEYKKYAWKNLFDPKLEGADRVNLYREAIEKMEFNPGAPELFREMFKGAELPFRDARTLNMFLKVINEFDYSHSEKLGDAFEYLLSFMGSQGDAGQFRTPRHIIDFIVEIVNPQKNEKILDPACGTAGFLISSFKHIQKQNTNKKSNGRLTATDRKRIGKNLVGYDISPDMTRLSLVNMYLHDFATPKIHEYDTLTSEDRWNEYYDVILANPPFFSPRGGIQPHSRFGVQSKRAEVLFVDYIMEHLKPKGRAGIIVPEGIIFKTDKAYKTLRKKLVEDYLVGVISLPAGVFNPYSGVKTSILILDKELHKKTDSVFFAKVENDGFDLGAQRTPIRENDLPSLTTAIQKRKEHSLISLVDRVVILSNASTILSENKYVEKETINSKFSTVPITEVFKVLNPSTKIKAKKFLESGKIPIVDQSKKLVAGYWNKDNDKIEISKPVVVFGDHTKVIKYVDFDFVAGADGIKILLPQPHILPKFFFYILQSIKLPDLGYSRHFKELKEFEIPLPPIKIQQEIVEELEGYQKVIDGCRQVVENYKATIDVDPSWKMVELGKVAQINPKKSEVRALSSDTQVSFVPMEDFYENQIYFESRRTKELGVVYNGYTYFRDKDVVMAKVTPCFENGKVSIVSNLKNGIGFGSSEFHVIRCGQTVLPEWIYINVITPQFRLKGIASFTGTSGLRRLPKSFVESYKIPIPSIDVQRDLIEKTKQETSIVDGAKHLIKIHTEKIQNRISKVWGE